MESTEFFGPPDMELASKGVLILSRSYEGLEVLSYHASLRALGFRNNEKFSLYAFHWTAGKVWSNASLVYDLLPVLAGDAHAPEAMSCIDTKTGDYTRVHNVRSLDPTPATFFYITQKGGQPKNPPPFKPPATYPAPSIPYPLALPTDRSLVSGGCRWMRGLDNKDTYYRIDYALDDGLIFKQGDVEMRVLYFLRPVLPMSLANNSQYQELTWVVGFNVNGGGLYTDNVANGKLRYA